MANSQNNGVDLYISMAMMDHNLFILLISMHVLSFSFVFGEGGHTIPHM